MDKTIRFIKAYPDANSAIPADPTALGTIPAAAMRYCEALRTASSFGWYAFPAGTVTLMFDGIDTYMLHGENWEILETEHVADPDDWWNRYCPENMVDLAPAFVTSIGNPGYVQIWSGLLVQTRQDWSTLVRPVANTTQSGQFACFEGIVETDQYGPAPLFVNLRLLATHTPITFHLQEPLFQVQPIHRSCYAAETMRSYTVDEPKTMTAEQWAGYRGSVRLIDSSADDHQLGQYATRARRRARQSSVVS
jgi:hypothetical protein